MRSFKHFFYLLVFYSACVCNPLNAHEISNKSDSLKNHNSILKFEVVHGGIQFEQKIKVRYSINIGLQYGYKSIFNPDEYSNNLTIDYRYSLFKKPNSILDFYIAGLAYYQDFIVAKSMNVNNLSIYSRDNVKALGIGLKAGIDLKINERLIIESFFGIGHNLYKNIKNVEGVPILNQNKYNTLAISGINIGYAF